MEMGNCLSILADLVVTGVAIYGLTVWKKSLRKEKEIALAEEILLSLYYVEQSFRMLRSDITMSKTVDEFIKNFSDTEEYFKKYDYLSFKLTSEYGDKYNILNKEIQSIKDEILKAALKLPRLKDSLGRVMPDQELNKLLFKIEELESILYTGIEIESDDYGKKIDALINQVKENIKPLLKI